MTNKKRCPKETKKIGCKKNQVRIEGDCVSLKTIKGLYQEIYMGLEWDKLYGSKKWVKARKNSMKRIRDAVGKKTTDTWEKETQKEGWIKT